MAYAGMISTLLFMVISINTFAEEVEVKQPILESRLGCESTLKRPICFRRAVKYSSPEAYIFEFDLHTDFIGDNLLDAIDLSMAQVSAMLNPLTAQYYGTEAQLIDQIDQSLFSSSDIIVALRTFGKADVYSSYFVPLVRDGDIVLFSRAVLGDKNVYELLKSRCDDNSHKNAPYSHNGQTCLLTYKE